MQRPTHPGFALDLNRLRLVAIVAPVAFLAGVEAVSAFGLGLLISSPGLRFAVVFLLLAVAAIPFTVWVFRVIERQQHDLARGAVLLESIQDHAIMMLDPDGRVVSWGPAGEQVMGYGAEEILGRPYATFFPPDAISSGDSSIAT